MLGVVEKRLEKLDDRLKEGLEDARKFDGGNAIAGRRLRKVLRQVCVDAQKLRLMITKVRKEREG